MTLLLVLYFAQGLPLGFMTQALPVILREQSISLEKIGYSGAILLPWGIKFLWAPLQDRYYVKGVGLARSWILPTQVVVLVATAALAWQRPELLRNVETAWPFVLLLFVLATAGAVQDVSTDGLAVRLLGAGKRSMGNAIQVAGNRIGLIVGGGGVLLMLDIAPWYVVMWCVFGLVLLTTIPVWLFREPDWQTLHVAEDAEAPAATGEEQNAFQRFVEFLRTEFSYFWSSAELRAWLGVLFVYKICDGLSSTMVKPMLVDMGYNKTEIGFAVTMLGAGAAALGAGAGYWAMRRLSRAQALIGFNAFQAITTGLYALMVWLFYQHGRDQTLDVWVYAVNALEHFAAAMALVAMLTTVMDYCRAKNGGSDFTLQVGIMAMVSGTAHWFSGHMATALGYTGHFVGCMVLGLVLLLPIVYWWYVHRAAHRSGA